MRRDVKINPSHDFFKDDEFWQTTERRPLYAAQFAPECTNFTIAHATPKIRSLANPIGDQKNPEVRMANLMLSRVVERCLLLLEKGSHILVENP